ncbi:Ribosomal protein S6 kinase alpha-2 [Coelomomyces lativittatus]|nr:Ribosomal protein S6 kinase alpha-2 [Coelomomyces lativittatus]KAJ1516446.1 Ribosomal protein S6 kinase alpha-2 [Coelomomyces lativittatus]
MTSTFIENFSEQKFNAFSEFQSEPKSKIIGKDDFVVLKLLGTGAFAKVYLVRHKQTNKYFAMKVMRKTYTQPKPNKKKKNGVGEGQAQGHGQGKPYTHGKRERDILASIANHPFLVTLRYAFQDEHRLYLVLDWAQGGELWAFVAKENLLLEPDARFYLAEIVLALEHLHGLGIIYRDLKLENILIDKSV